MGRTRRPRHSPSATGGERRVDLDQFPAGDRSGAHEELLALGWAAVSMPEPLEAYEVGSLLACRQDNRLYGPEESLYLGFQPAFSGLCDVEVSKG
jgi:hypothetical protein